jgi:hypothetical protein
MPNPANRFLSFGGAENKRYFVAKSSQSMIAASSGSEVQPTGMSFYL